MKNLLLYPGYYYEGYQACQQYLGDTSMINNPYKAGSTEGKAWASGWAEALQRLPTLAY